MVLPGRQVVLQVACVALALTTALSQCTSTPGNECVGTSTTPVACVSGSYNDAPGGTCSLCPAGSECPSQSASPSACPAGEYSSAGATSCTACAAGTFSTGGAASCTLCPAGSSCTATTATSCPAGRYSTGGLTTCLACPSGTYDTAGGATACTVCPAGSQCSAPASAPVACGAGEYSPPGSTSCTACPSGTRVAASRATCEPCPAGEECGAASAATTACNAGEWKPPGSSSCEPCPAGSACASATAPPVPCAAGRYSAASATACTSCTAGNACPDPAGGETACLAGFYADGADRTSCTECPAGRECPSTSALGPACASGRYSLPGATACTNCLAGTACPSTAREPVTCPPGTYATAGQASCTICPAGFECPSNTAAGSACSTGEYAPEGSTSCLPCPAGHECPSASSPPVPCPPGEYSAAGDDDCDVCPAGSVCTDAGTATPVACPAGTYALAGSTECTLCPAGSVCPSTSNPGSITTCAPGTYSLAGTSTACTACPAGYMCADTAGSDRSIIPCPAGTYSTGSATTCTECAAGNMCPFTDQAVSIACGSGEYALARSTFCSTCPAGHFCASSSAPPTPCPYGERAAAGATSCTQCPAGFSCESVTDPTQTTACAAGYVSGAGDMDCHPCEAGYFCNDATNPNTQANPCPDGQVSGFGEEACTPCPAGYFCDDHIRQMACPPGEVCAGTGNDAGSSCLAGDICPPRTSDAGVATADCPIGWYCPAGAASVPCPAGRYGAATGQATLASGCTPCEAGLYCPFHTREADSRRECPAGHYCPASTSEPVMCPAGRYRRAKGGTVLGDCTQCPAGRYCPEASKDIGFPCPEGKYCTLAVGAPQDCPAGRYSGKRIALTASTDCFECPLGHYCDATGENRLMAPEPCPVGRYGASVGLTVVGDCTECPAGHSCDVPGLSWLAVRCVAGHFCPAGNAHRYDPANRCAAGTYTDALDATSQGACLNCPPGFTCDINTGGDHPPYPCLPGYYCPGSVQTGNTAAVGGACAAGQLCPCAPGTFGQEDNLQSQAECTDCPPGHWCAGGLATASGLCSVGYYCPRGSSTATQVACPGGRYSASTGLDHAEQCTLCPKGHYCPSPATSTTPCPAGTYLNSTGNAVVGDCIACPPGYVCAGTGNEAPSPCGVGRHSAVGATSCSTCTAGRFCDLNTTSTAREAASLCPAGTLCPAGQAKFPELSTEPCPAGHYCLEGVWPEIACGAGTYQPHKGATSSADCLACPAGYFCSGGEAAPSGRCDPGYFCPASSTSAQQQPCPIGTWRSGPGGRATTDCAACPSGFYCPSVATTSPTLCPSGAYCISGQSGTALCPAGTYGEQTGLRRPEDCTPCRPGFYCQNAGNSGVSGPCAAGYYCLEGSTTPTPTDGIEGDVCPAGGYCPAGSSQPTPCPIGKYLPTAAESDESACILCPPGSYCQGSSSPNPSGPCDPGYFCPTNSSTPKAFSVPPGKFSAGGQGEPQGCDPGRYSPTSRATACDECLPGFRCPNSNMTTPDSCPLGYFCPASTILGTENPCPPGRYSASVYAWTTQGIDYSRGLSAAEDCTPCPPGFHCPTPAMTSPGPACAAGHWCMLASATSAPTAVDLPAGQECPAGHYCESGTVLPTICPNGTYRATAGGSAVGDCTACPAGSYCNQEDPTSVLGLCDPGFFCAGGADTPRPLGGDSSGGPCPVGNQCPAGSPSGTNCPAGTYASVRGLAACEQCPAGFFCDGIVLTAPQACPAARYCPAGTGAPQPVCPAGTLSAVTGRASVQECILCPAGSYCATPGLSVAVTDPCDAGFVCEPGSTTARGQNGGTITSDVPCPQGFYCPAGSGEGTPCPEGTFGSRTGLVSVDECSPCSAGQYCGGIGLTAPSGPCLAGYFCNRGNEAAGPEHGVSTVILPITSLEPGAMVVGGGPCPAGHRCPAGTSVPDPCPAGSHQPDEGQAGCVPCPAGHACPAGTTDFSTAPCPTGHYCPQGTAAGAGVPCPAGTFNSLTGLRAASECQPCSPGQYCNITSSSPTGTCSVGYFCTLGATTPTPTDGVTGDLCPAGTSCPAGTAVPEPCPPGSFCADTSGIVTGLCSAGYFCTIASFTSTPAGQVNTVFGGIGDECPAGHFCPAGSISPSRCPAGRFRSTTLATAVSDCALCTAGSYCPGEGTITPSLSCLAGYYCPTGSSIPAQQACPRGHACPAGAPAPTPCAAGTFQDVAGQATCKTCPAGGFCVAAAEEPVICPVGHYCPAGTTSGTQYPCPAGTYNDVPGKESAAGCKNCLPGKFCAVSGQSAPAGDCSAGHYCLQGSSAAAPTEGEDNGYTCSVGGYGDSSCPVATGSEPSIGDACPPGHFCPLGSSHPLQCPPGTFAPASRQAAETNCSPCTAGFYCPQAGTADASVFPCPAGFYCPQGSVQPVLSCPPGSACAAGSASPTPCSAGTFQDMPSQSACKPCIDGHYCPEGSVHPPVCLPGSYCPLGTADPGAFLCPNGTFNPFFGIQASHQCTPCTPGSYCANEGAATVSGPCAAGHFCESGSGSATPTIASNGLGPGRESTFVGDACPAGTYCPAGSTQPTPCPPGTFRSGSGGTSVGSCSTCPAGQYCPQSGMTSGTTFDCPAGLYCPAGTVTPELECTLGHYCPTRSGTPLSCVARTFSNTTGAAVCTDCPAGYFCPGTTINPSPCPAGRVCPARSANAVDVQCFVGTFSSIEQVSDTADCTACLQGQYCGSQGLTAPTGLCQSGHFCTRGSILARPGVLDSGGSPCIDGFICNEGSYVPNPASNFTGTAATNASIALQLFSSTLGQVNPGYACPPGVLCTGGDSMAGCPPGTFNPSWRVGACLTCPAGEFCPGNTSTPLLCPELSYCPAGSSAPQLCPAGTHAIGRLGLAGAAQCTQCPPGKFCTNGDIAGDCAAGHVCYQGVATPNPVGIMPNGDLCPRGFFCPPASAVPTPCANGTFSGSVGASLASDCGVCPPGFTCVDGFPEAFSCRPGFFCPGASIELPCPTGTFNPDIESTSNTSCRLCPPGTHCTQMNTTDPFQFPCPLGHYCATGGGAAPVQCPVGTFRDEMGAANVSDCATCPGGYTCANGTSVPSPCLAGTFCPLGSHVSRACPGGSYCPPLSSTPTTCPAGFFCPESSSHPQQCERGTYCVEGVSTPTTCPSGTFAPPDASNISRTSLERACTACEPGTFSESVNGTECYPCTPGFVCLGLTSSATPLNAQTDRGYKCPKGHYCPQGSFRDRPCPLGTYNPLEGASDITACLKCRNGTFSATQGSAACLPCSASSYTLDNGATECICRGDQRYFQPYDGKCLCAPQFEAFDSNGNMASEADGDEDCQPMNFEFCLLGLKRLANGECKDVDCNAVSQCASGKGTWSADLGGCACEGLPAADDLCGPSCRAGARSLAIDPAQGHLLVRDGESGNVTSLSLDEDVPGFFGRLSCTEVQERARQASQTLETSNASRSIITSSSCDVFSLALDGAGFAGIFGVDDAVAAATPGSGRRLREALSEHAPSWRGRLLAEQSMSTFADVAHEVHAEIAEEVLSAVEGSWASHQLHARAGSIVAALAVGLSQEPFPLQGKAHGRALQGTVSGSTPVMRNPTSCVEVGEGLLFSLGTTADGRRIYPVYQKDSFLNSNPQFDYGAFRDLAEIMSDPTLSAGVSHFGYTFETPGTYVFASSIDASQQFIVRAVAIGQACPAALGSSPFNPGTEENLVSLGVGQAVTPQLVPDWRLIAALLVGLFMAAAIFMGCVYYWRTASWEDAGTAGLLSKDYERTRQKAASVKASPWGQDRGPVDALCCVSTCGLGRCRSRQARNGAAGSALYCCGRRTCCACGTGAKGGDETSRGAGTPGSGSTDEKDQWNPDAMDLQQLLQLMQAHDEDLSSGFRASRDALERARRGIVDEAGSLRRLIAQSSIDARAEGVTSGTAAQASQRAAVLRQLETELAAHKLWDKQLARREAAVMDAVRALGDALGSDSHSTAHAMVSDILKHDPKLADHEEEVAALGSLRPADSERGEGIRRMLSHAVDVIRRYKAAVTAERARREQAVGMLRAASNASITEVYPEVAAALQAYEASMLPLDASLDRHLGMLTLFADGGDAYAEEQTKQLSSFLAAFVQATTIRNPTAAARVRAEHGDALAPIVEQLIVAVQALLARFSASSARVELARMKAAAAAGDALYPIQQAKAADAKVAREGGISRSAMSTVRNRLVELIAAVEAGLCDPNAVLVALGLLPESALRAGGGTADDLKAAATAASLLAQEDEDLAAERSRLEADLEDQVGLDQAQLDAEDERAAQEALQRELALRPEMSVEEQERILERCKVERSALRESLARERARQRELLNESLEARKAERVAKRLARAEVKANQAAAEAANNASEALAKRQARDRQAEAADAEAELQEELAAARAAAGLGHDAAESADAQLDAERALASLRDSHEADIQSLRTAQAQEQARQAASVAERVQVRRLERQERARQAKQQALAAAGADLGQRATLLAGAAVEVEGLFEELQRLEAEDFETAEEEAKAMSARHADDVRTRRQAFIDELASLQGRVGTEKAARQSDARSAVQAAFAKKRKALLSRHEEELQDAASLVERKALSAKHAAEVSALAATEEAELAAVDAKVDAAAASATAELEAASAAAQLALIRDEAEAQGDTAKSLHTLRLGMADERVARQIAALRNKEELELLARQAREMAEVAGDPDLVAKLTEKHNGEWVQLQRRLKREEAELREQAESAIQGHQEELDAQMAALRAGYEREAGALRDALSAEKARQQAAAMDRKAQRRTRRAEALRRRQAAELEAATRESEEAAAAMAQEHARQAEAAAEAASAAEAAEAAAAQAEAELVAATFEADSALRRLREQRDAEISSRSAAMSAEKRKQEAALSRKLEDRRARRLAKLQQQQAEERAAAEAAAVNAAEREALAAQHAAEQAEVEADLAQEAETERKALAAQMRSKYEAAKAKDAEAALALEDQAAEIRLQAASNANTLLRSLQSEKSRQLAGTEAKLRARKQRRLRKLRRQQQQELAEAASKGAAQSAEAHLAAILADEDEAEDFEAAVLAAVAALTAGQDPGAPREGVHDQQRQEVEADIQAQARELEVAHMDEVRAEERAHAEELAAELRAFEQATEERRQAELAAKRAELEARMAVLNADNQEEFERIRADTDREMARVEARLSDQKKAQRADLQRRLAKRRARKQQALQRKQAREKADIAKRREAALASLVSAAETQDELQAVRDLLARGDSLVTRETAGAAVEAIMKKRHEKEQSEMLKHQMEERSEHLKVALGDMLDGKADAREDTLAQLKAIGATEAEVSAHMQEFEDHFSEQLAEVERAIIRQLEAEHAEQKLELKQQQLQETAAFLAEVAPDDVQRRKEAEAALVEATKLRDFQAQLEKQREERAAKAEADRVALQARLDAEAAAELSAQEEAMKAKMEERRRQADEQMAAQRQRMQQAAAEARAKLLADANELADEDRDRVLAEFDAAQAAKEQRLEAQKKAQENRMKAQLAKRQAKARRKKEKAVAAKLAEERAQAAAAEEQRRQEELARQKATAAAAGAGGAGDTSTSSKVRDAVSKLQAASHPETLSKAGSSKSILQGARSAATLGESFRGQQSSHALLVEENPQVTAIVGKLNAMDTLLSQLQARASAAAPGSPDGPGADPLAASSLWLDVTSPPPEGHLGVVPRESLNARESLRLLVGRKLLSAVGFPAAPEGVSLEVADSLPINNYVGNAYRHVYWFDPATRTLHIRRSRLVSTGDFVVCLAHALAHIRVNANDLSNDALPAFQGEFHRMLRLIGQQLASASGQLSLGQSDSDAEDDEEYGEGAGTAASGGVVQQSVAELLSSIKARAEAQAASKSAEAARSLQRKSSGGARWRTAAAEVTALRAMGVDRATLQGRDDAGDSDVDEDELAVSGNGRWTEGTLPARISSVGALSKHTELQRFLASLEDDVLKQGAEEAGGGEALPASPAASRGHRRGSSMMQEADLLQDLPEASAAADAAMYRTTMQQRIDSWEKKVDEANEHYVKYQMRMQQLSQELTQKRTELEANKAERSAVEAASIAAAQVQQLQENGKPVPEELLAQADTSRYAASADDLEHTISLNEAEVKMLQHNHARAQTAADTWADRLRRWGENLSQDKARLNRNSRKSVFEQSEELRKLRAEAGRAATGASPFSTIAEDDEE